MRFRFAQISLAVFLCPCAFAQDDQPIEVTVEHP
jgi:hypothetical protein